MKHVIPTFLFFFGFTAALAAQKTARGTELSVFPNPATEYISVRDDSDTVDEVVVFNLVGKKMRSFTFAKGSNYYVADLPKGMYLVQMLDRNDKVLFTQRVNKR